MTISVLRLSLEKFQVLYIKDNYYFHEGIRYYYASTKQQQKFKSSKKPRYTCHRSGEPGWQIKSQVFNKNFLKINACLR